MEEKKCAFVVGMNEDKTYKRCGEPASYRVGYWDVCKGHKKYYCDPRKWVATPLEEVEDNEETYCGC
jgi:hypothetical protein